MKHNYQHTLKTLLLLLASNFLLLTANAQFVKNDWGAYFGSFVNITSDANIQVRDIQSDANGNVFACGKFYGTVDFDPGNGVVSLTSGNTVNGGDAWFAKYNSSGSLLWVKALTTGGTYSSADQLTIDGSGNIYLGGSSLASIDLDPGVGTTYTTGGASWFLAKYNTNGDFQWGSGSGNVGSGLHVAITDLFINSSNELVVLSNTNHGSIYSGSFSVTRYDLASGSAAGSGSILPSTNNSIYTFDWQIATDHFKGTQDASGNYIVVGNYRGSIDADMNGGVTSLTSVNQTGGGADMFVCKYNSSLALQWAFSLGAPNGGGLFSAGITTDASGNVYVGGTLMDTVDFDPGSGVTLLYPDNTINGRGFIAKYSASGAFVWAKHISETQGTGEYERTTVDDIKLSTDGNSIYYLSRNIQANDYNSSSSDNLIFPFSFPDGEYVGVIGNWDLNGNLVNANVLVPATGSGWNPNNCLWVDGNSNLYVGIGEIYRNGAAFNNVSFGACGNNPNSLPDGMQSSDAFIAKYSACSNHPIITVQPQDTVGCIGLELSVNVGVSNAACKKYHWMRNTNPIGLYSTWTWESDSAVLYFPSFHLADTGTYICTVEGECGSVSTNVFTIGSREPVYLGGVPPVDVTICSGSDYTFSYATLVGSTIQGDGPFSYQWKKGNTVLSNSQTYTLNDATVANSGIYYYIVTDLCTSDTLQVNFTVDQAPNSTPNPTTASFCTGGSVDINSPGNINEGYYWLDASYNNYSFSSPVNITIPGTYYLVTYNTLNICSDTSAAIVVTENSIPAEPTISLNGVDLVSNYATGNQWYLDGNIINGATGQSYTPLVNGNYTVEHTDANGCTSLQSTPYNVNSVGIENTVDAGVSITPNPSSGVFIVSVNNQSAYQIEVHNSLGQLVYTAGTQGSTTTIDLQNHAAGVYTITITAGEKVMHSKIIKN